MRLHQKTFARFLVVASKNEESHGCEIDDLSELNQAVRDVLSRCLGDTAPDYVGIDDEFLQRDFVSQIPSCLEAGALGIKIKVPLMDLDMTKIEDVQLALWWDEETINDLVAGADEWLGYSFTE